MPRIVAGKRRQKRRCGEATSFRSSANPNLMPTRASSLAVLGDPQQGPLVVKGGRSRALKGLTKDPTSGVLPSLTEGTAKGSAGVANLAAATVTPRQAIMGTRAGCGVGTVGIASMNQASAVADAVASNNRISDGKDVGEGGGSSIAAVAAARRKVATGSNGPAFATGKDPTRDSLFRYADAVLGDVHVAGRLRDRGDLQHRTKRHSMDACSNLRDNPAMMEYVRFLQVETERLQGAVQQLNQSMRLTEANNVALRKAIMQMHQSRFFPAPQQPAMVDTHDGGWTLDKQLGFWEPGSQPAQMENNNAMDRNNDAFLRQQFEFMNSQNTLLRKLTSVSHQEMELQHQMSTLSGWMQRHDMGRLVPTHDQVNEGQGSGQQQQQQYQGQQPCRATVGDCVDRTRRGPNRSVLGMSNRTNVRAPARMLLSVPAGSGTVHPCVTKVRGATGLRALGGAKKPRADAKSNTLATSWMSQRVIRARCDRKRKVAMPQTFRPNKRSQL